ncbi:phosphate/phosphite/phosphonate ABC transporter substrate-binding protein [Arenimonas donghaensis]|nr:PhnD/SsuA/transferrin family substrate-binding protein [Arenimonas donghaensis]
MMIRNCLLTVAMALAAAPAMAANYTLAVEPNYPPAQAEMVYQPLLDYLSASTGHKFKLKTAANYHVYWRDLRAGMKVDFAFEEAHFAGYRMGRLGFTPLVRTAEPTRYSLVADSMIAEEGTAGLIGRPVVSMPSPSMGYLLMLEIYRNPIAAPEIKSVGTGWRDGVEMIFSQETQAAMVPNYIAQLYPNLVVVSESREFVGRTLSAAGTVPSDVQDAVAEAMLKLHEDPGSYEVLVELGASSFVDAPASDYTRSESLLAGVFGYKPRPAAPVVEDEPQPEAIDLDSISDEELGGLEVTAGD